jgi:DNA-binding MarR family transcriptional regulator
MKPSTETLCDDLMHFFMTVKGHMIRLADEQSLTPVQLGALHSLYSNGELAMGQVADVLHCDASNVTGIVDRLVAQGLITRQESSRDRRTKTLNLTESGTKIVEHIRKSLPLAMGWDTINPDDYALFHRIIQTMQPEGCKLTK